MSPAGGGVVHRAHPFTPFVVTLAVAALALLLPAPRGPVMLYAVVVLLAIATGVGRAVRAAALVCLPLWLFLFVLLALLGDGPRVAAGPVTLSRAGLDAALAQGARLGAIATASFGLIATFQPSRFLDAVAARGWPFSVGYLLVATLQAVPRFRLRAATILAAQRTRGLRLRGTPVRRLAALVPLTMPLMLGALTEIDERAMALETRGVEAAAARTPLAPPVERAADHAIWALLVVLVLAALLWRLLG